MKTVIGLLLDPEKLRAGAKDAMIMEAEMHLGVKLPGEYVEFLRVTNGYEGFVGENGYAMLWSAEELPQMNREYQVKENVPGFLVFGSSGGGEAYGFDTRLPHWPIVQIPWIPLEWDLAESLGSSFAEFLHRLGEAA